MMLFDLCESIAVLLVPIPSNDEQCGDPDDVLEALLQERRATAERLWTIWEGADEDPLLVALSEAHWRRRQADHEVRRLLAFGREFVRPRPYELAVLAEAGGLSASGAKTAYKAHHVAEVAAALGRSPVRRPSHGTARLSGHGTQAKERARIVQPAAGGTESLRYRRIAAGLRDQIQSGALPQGSRLPSVRDLMAAHGVAMATVRHALQVLTDEQLIHAVQGVGTFVGPLPAHFGTGLAEVPQ
ncbi:winged helix-turn-helix domain-containing protein [Streptomyces sp. NPDC005538]|uniref:winged helix-turn-helix domain-containing protein n=1 Tax=Streptomyces sp. NPDC005538 TaxID=3157043 RepID=UPI0033B968E6